MQAWTMCWKPRCSVLLLRNQDVLCARLSVLCASLVFSKNKVPGIGRMPRSLKIGIEAARLLEKEISQIFVALSAWN